MLRENAWKIIGPVTQQPHQPGLLFVGFKAWSGPQAGPEDPLREHLIEHVTRAVWDLEDGRLALAAMECDSTGEALERLADQLEDNQLAEVPPGPGDLGEVSFVHPTGVSPAVFFVRGNLMLSVFSFARAPAEVFPFARELDAALSSRPKQVREDGLEVTEEGQMIHARAVWAGPDAYLQFFAPGATLLKRGSSVEVRGEPAEVEIYAIERGREIYGRRLLRKGTIR